MKLYTFFRGSSPFRLRIALNLKGLRYEAVPVHLGKGEHRKPDYLKLNPKGRVPVLVHEDQTLTESAAILMHLADRHPAAALAPMPSMPERGRYYQWLLYFSNTVQAAMSEYFHPDWYLDDPGARSTLKSSAPSDALARCQVCSRSTPPRRSWPVARLP